MRSSGSRASALRTRSSLPRDLPAGRGATHLRTLSNSSASLHRPDRALPGVPPYNPPAYERARPRAHTLAQRAHRDLRCSRCRFSRTARWSRSGDRIEWVGAGESTLPAASRDHRLLKRTISEAAGSPPRWSTATRTLYTPAIARPSSPNACAAFRTRKSPAAAAASPPPCAPRALRASSSSSMKVLPGSNRCLPKGVGTVEIKSGYGLTFEDEAKMLRVARQLARDLFASPSRPPFSAPTPCRRSSRDGRMRTSMRIASEWLPRLHAENLVDAVDIFCENIAFDLAQCWTLVRRGATRWGCPSRCTPSSFPTSAAPGSPPSTVRSPAITWNTRPPTDVSALARAGTVAVLLPIAFYSLAETRKPPVAAMREHGIADGGGQRLQSGVGSGRLAPARAEHGEPPVWPHFGRSTGRQRPAMRPGPGRSRQTRAALAPGNGSRFRHLGHRRHRRAGLLVADSTPATAWLGRGASDSVDGTLALANLAPTCIDTPDPRNQNTRLVFPGGVPKRPTGADCKSAGLRLRRFESFPLHHRARGKSPAKVEAGRCGHRRV